MRARRPSCVACGSNRQDAILETDYVAFCGGNLPDWVVEGKKDGPRRVRALVRL